MKAFNRYLKEYHGFGLTRINYNKGALDFAIRYFKAKKVKVIEIGTYRGINAQHLFNKLNIDKLFLIDPYVGNSEYSKEDLGKSEKIMKKGFEGEKDVLLIKDYASNVKERFKDESIDFVYIDGSHKYKNVVKDIENYFPKVKVGGIFGGHDIDISGVLQAVSEFAVNNNLKLNAKNNDWWIVK